VTPIPPYNREKARSASFTIAKQKKAKAVRKNQGCIEEAAQLTAAQAIESTTR